MHGKRIVRSLAVLLLGAIAPVVAQPQVSVETPFRRAGDRFFENIGVRWGFRHQSRNGVFFFRHGGPRFTGFHPSNPATFGLSGRSGNTSWNLGIFADQGSSRGVVSQTPSLVLPSGPVGFLSHTVQQPFVTGIVPVVGGWSVSPLPERLMRLRYQQALRNTESKGKEVDEEPPRAVKSQPRPKDDPPLILRGKTKAAD